MKRNLALFVFIICFFVSCGDNRAPQLTDKDSSHTNTETPGDKSPANPNKPSPIAASSLELLKLQNKDQIKVNRNGDSFTFTNTRDSKSIILTLFADKYQTIGTFNDDSICFKFKDGTKKDIRCGYYHHKTDINKVPYAAGIISITDFVSKPIEIEKDNNGPGYFFSSVN
jgi:hypothetical protein